MKVGEDEFIKATSPFWKHHSRKEGEMKRNGLMIAALGIFLFAQVALAQGTPTERLTWNSRRSELPAIAIDSTHSIHIVWEDGTPGNDEIY